MVKKSHGIGYNFINRSSGREKLCLVLAGYKKIIWKDVFDRLKDTLPGNIDVCVLSSGLYSKELDEISEENNWSYLYTRKNQLCHIQNLAIELHPNAQWIYKIDEDIFLTKGFFEKTMETWIYANKEMDFCPSLVAPLINVNGYCYIKLLDKLGLRETFQGRFGQIKMSSGIEHHEWTRDNAEFARYMWGSDDEGLRDIDALTDKSYKEPLKFSLCPIRFSIGAILFHRDFWKEIKGFPVKAGNGLGDDEEYISLYAINNARPIVVNENVVVGHLGFGPQTEAMINYYKKNPDIFRCKNSKSPEENIKILVSCHKECDVPASTIYYPIEAGSALRMRHFNDYYRDDEGDNISSLNYTFSELSVIYWAWKNLNARYYGSCHYRRFFYFGEKEYPMNDHAQIEEDSLDTKTLSKYGISNDAVIRQMMEKYDLIAPIPFDVRKAPTPNGFKDNIFEHMEGYGLITKRDIDLLIELTDKMVPEWSEMLRTYISGHDYIGYNCFIMSKDLFYEFCEKQFRILLTFAHRNDHYGIEERLCGYLGEILFSTFVLMCEKNGKRVKNAPLLFFKNTDKTDAKEKTIESVKKYVKFIPPSRNYLNRKFREVSKQIRELKDYT